MNTVRAWQRFTGYLSEDLLGGPRPWQLNHVVNFQKGGTVFFVLALMFFYGNFSTTAWVYLGLHGSYGLIWLLKELACPDPGFKKKITIAGGINVFLLVLGPYWLAPFLLVSQGREASPALMGACILLYAVGVVVMMVSDAQKFFVLKVKRGLIGNGMFARMRHPNYTGEMMVYGSFALLVQHWIPVVVLAWVWGGVFLPRILSKEASMSRYPEWAAYKARTGYLLPKLFVSSSSATELQPGE
jgi:protein-S-isoprenylcysteine O-methyltransferase Ste14